MIQGPFRAEISVSEQLVTLFLDNLYAGRFPARVPAGIEPQQTRVIEKTTGGVIRLEGNLSIASETAEPAAGTIAVSQKDASDILSILSENSTILIRK